VEYDIMKLLKTVSVTDKILGGKIESDNLFFNFSV
jgi:hypothetical protein